MAIITLRENHSIQEKQTKDIIESKEFHHIWMILHLIHQKVMNIVLVHKEMFNKNNKIKHFQMAILNDKIYF